jgi:hypothetical protein
MNIDTAVFKATLFLVIVMSAVEGKAAGPPCPIAANLTVVKGSYMAGEPVEVRLTANNTGREPASIAALYPTFATGNGSGISFSVAEELRVVHPPQTAQRPSIIASLKVPILPLAAGETWAVSIFLQSFMPDLPPGTHQIGYSVKLECFGQNVLAAGTADGQGVLSVVVLNTKEAELGTAIADLASRLNTTDYWAQRSAQEGLLVTNSPLVIPWLRPMLWDAKGAVVRALAKFPGNPEAESIVLGVLRDGRINESLLALSVMEQWKYLLNPDDFEGVLVRGNSPERRTALRYADSIGSRMLIPAVSAYVEDPDPQVAAEAKRVADALNEKGR